MTISSTSKILVQFIRYASNQECQYCTSRHGRREREIFLGWSWLLGRISIGRERANKDAWDTIERGFDRSKVSRRSVSNAMTSLIISLKIKSVVLSLSITAMNWTSSNRSCCTVLRRSRRCLGSPFEFDYNNISLKTNFNASGSETIRIGWKSNWFKLTRAITPFKCSSITSPLFSTKIDWINLIPLNHWFIECVRKLFTDRLQLSPSLSLSVH